MSASPRAVASAGTWLARLFPAILLFYSALLPQEVRIEVAGVAFYSYRVVCLLLVPVAFLRLVKGVVRWGVVDWMVLAGAFWMLISFGAFYGPEEGVPRALALAVEVMMPYFVARVCITDLTDLRRFLVVIAPGAALAGLSLMAESVGGARFVKPAFAQVFGVLPQSSEGVEIGAAELRDDFRFGLLRGYGPFSHPILAGVFLASLFPLYLASGIRSWPFILGLAAGIAAVFTVSSAAIMVLGLTIGLLIFDLVQKRVGILNWRLLILVAVAVIVLLEVFTEAGAVRVLGRLAFSSATALNRIRIWDYGTASVLNFPLFGIGFDAIERPNWMVPSIDNEWLLLAIRHGMPTSFLLLAAAVSPLFTLARTSKGRHRSDERLIVALIITMFSMILAAFTVSFFGGIKIWFWMLIGMAVSLAAGRIATR